MQKIILTAESGSDLTKEQAQLHGIEMVPMHVSMGDETFDDGSFPPSRICEYYTQHGVLPKTSGSTTYDFETAFERIHREHPDAHILHLAYSAVTTVSYQCAVIAAEDKDYITIIDTKHVSAGQGVAVLLIADYLKNHPDISPADLAAEALRISESVKMDFVPGNLEYLRAGGRCSNMAYIAGQLLKFHPNIEILDGKLIATKKYRGHLRRIIPKMIADCKEAHQLKTDALWFLRSTGLDPELQTLAEESATALGFQKLAWVDTGCVITTHCGPGSFGVVGVSEK